MVTMANVRIARLGMGPSPLPKSLSYDHSSGASTSSRIVQIIITIEDSKRVPGVQRMQKLDTGPRWRV